MKIVIEILGRVAYTALGFVLCLWLISLGVI